MGHVGFPLGFDWSQHSLRMEVTNHQKLLNPFMGKTRSNFIHFPISLLVLGHVSTWHWVLGLVLCSPHPWVVSGL